MLCINEQNIYFEPINVQYQNKTHSRNEQLGPEIPGMHNKTNFYAMMANSPLIFPNNNSKLLAFR